MAHCATIHNSSFEQVIPSLPNDTYDIALAMAVLEHLRRTSDWVFAEMARISRRYIITVEDEAGRSWRHFPRKSDEIFEPLGLVQVKWIDCSDVEGVGPGFSARAFRAWSHLDAVNPKPT